MKRLRISGLVGLAKRIRQELAGPVSPERLAQLRQEVADAVTGIEQIFKEKHVRAQSLPAPSKKAVQFLKSLDWDAVVTEESGSGGRFPPESVSFGGLRRHFENLLDRLAQVAQPPPAENEVLVAAGTSFRAQGSFRSTSFPDPSARSRDGTARLPWGISCGAVP